MAETAELTPDDIRARRAEAPKLRDRDLAENLGISEAELVAAHVGVDGPRRALRVEAHPDRLMPAAEAMGEVMALTRNPSAVHEKIGRYGNYHPGQHAAMVLTEAVDLRIFPSHWRHAFLVEVEGDGGTRRSLQVFDAAGDAVHKVILREGFDTAAWDRAKAELALDDRSQAARVAPREAPEAAKSRPDRAEELRAEWRKMTDTHQFLRMVSKLKMNRLGAYRIAGAPFVRRLAPGAVDAALHAVRDDGVEIMLFVGNRGCIQIHSGGIGTLTPMGPWQNVMDPDFNLHLRRDHLAEVWAVEKPTQRGPAVSVEAFDGEGRLILQCFAIPKEGRDSRPAWARIVERLENAEDAPAP
ncbi:hemin-degrading factor [Rhodovulum sp. 12E13]|uniref:hemin-degrading factor n=1 Tax=Rhodovulum sp. 12E13 TaxID=2203891 RepID=UPI000E16188E|nr:ChuX/HutX family heme-like substrate-binding protein [Rhodovulum sp. 12E13]RDC71018.1 hemin-degrading factor [Rhodovulum sp. 12E13]